MAKKKDKGYLTREEYEAKRGVTTRQEYEAKRQADAAAAPRFSVEEMMQQYSDEYDREKRRRKALLTAGQNLYTSLNEQKQKNPYFQESMIRGAEKISKQPFTPREKFEIRKYNVTGKEPKPLVPENSAIIKDRSQMVTAYLGKLKRQAEEARAQRDMTYQGIKDNRELNGTGFNFDVNQYIETQQKVKENQAKGLNDSGNDPRHMSDEGLEAWRKGYQEKYDQAIADIEKLNKQKTMRDEYQPWLGWGNQVYDYIHDLGIRNEDTILNGEGYTEDEKRNAWWAKTELEDSYQSGREEAMEDARTFYNNEYVGGGFADTEYDKQNMRELAYEQIMGEKYADRVAKMTPEQKAELDNRIDQAIEAFKNPYDGIDYDDKMRSRAREAGAYQQAVEIATKEQEDRNIIGLYAQQAAKMDVSPTYDRSLLPEPKMVFDDTYDDYVPMPQGSETDQAYFWANEYQNYPFGKAYDYANKYMFVRALGDDVLDQLNTFYKFDKQNGTRSTDSFLQALDPYLQQCLAEFQTWYFQEKAEDPKSAIAARIMSPALNTVGGFIGTVGTAAAALGLKSAQEETSGWYTATKAVKTIRSQQNENVGKWAERVFGEGSGEVAQKLLGVIDSVADNVFAMGTGTAIAGDNTTRAMRLVQLIMSGEATSNRMLELLEKNADPTEAALYAIGDGVIEWLTEKYSLERIMGPDIKQLVGNKRALASFIARSMGAEGSEEIASDLLNMVLDDVMSNIYGHKNEIQQRYDELVASGMGDKEATQQALMEKLDEIGWSFLAGSLSGGLMAGGRVVMNTHTERGIGWKLNKSESGLKEIIDSIKGMDENTESYKLAEEINKKLEKGIVPSNYDVGRLAQLAMMESNEQIKGKVKNIVKETVLKDLEGNSEREDMAEIIAKALDDPRGTDALTKEERSRLNANHDALQVYYKYKVSSSESRQQLKEEIQKGTEAETKVENSIAENLRTKKPTRGNINITKFATPEDIQQAEENGPRTGGAREVIVDGKFATVQQVKVEKIKGKWQARIQLNDGRTVETSQIKATNYGIAQIINQAAISPEFFSEKYTNLLLKAREEGRLQDTQKALDDAAAIRIAAYIGKDVPKTDLDKKLANEIWLQSANEHANNGKRDTGKFAKGTVKYKGLEYNTPEYNEAVSKLEPALRSAVDYVGSVFHAAGIELDMDDMGDPSVYGTYDTNTRGISINLFGQNFTLDGKADTRHNIVVTAGHELTHWLKDNSPVAYRRLERYVMQQYAKRDYNEMIRRLNHFMYQDGLDLEGAIDEIVANSSDQVLGDEETVKHIKETDAKLYGHIRSFVQNLVEKMKAAINGMQESASKDARFMLAKGVNRLNKLWTGALDEALEKASRDTRMEAKPEVSGKEAVEAVDRYAEEMENAPEEKKQSKAESLAELDEMYEEAYNNYDVEEGERLVAEAAERAMPDSKIRDENGKLKVVYHQTNAVNDNGEPFTVFDMERARQTFDIVGAFFAPEYDEYHEYGDRTYAVYLDIKKPAYDVRFKTNVMYAGLQERNKLIKQGYDGVINTEDGKPYEYVAFYPEQIKSAEAFTEDDDGNLIPLSLRFNNYNKDIRWSRMEKQDGYWTDMDQVYYQDGAYYIRNTKTGEVTELQGKDREYAEAWRNADYNKMEAMLMDKIRKNGAIPFKAPESYNTPDHMWIANAIKQGNMDAIRHAAAEMATMVPDNAVLVPMPNHYGKVNDDTDTFILAQEISKITGSPVIKALEGVERESRKADKNKPKSQQMKAEDLGLHQVQEIPEGKIPYIVDNVIASGLTAQAAHQALGNNGVTLAYAKSTRNANEGLKRANVTFYDTNKQYGQYLIPYQNRIDMQKKGFTGTKFSSAELDEEYMKAAESGDMDRAQWMVNEAAERAGYTETVYHGTQTFGFTEFDMDKSQDEIFVTFDKNLAKTYTTGEMRDIGITNRVNMNKIHSMTPTEIIDFLKNEHPLMGMKKITEVELIKPSERTGPEKDIDEVFGEERPENEEWYRIRYEKDNTPRLGEPYIELSRAQLEETLRLFNKKSINAPGIYTLFARPGKQLVVDADGNNWNRIPFDPLWDEAARGMSTYAFMNGEEPNDEFKTREIADWARRNGYDSVRINDVHDDGGIGDGNGYGDIGIFFNTKDVKSADAVVYDDNGEIIPLSKRFTDNTDLRYSRAQLTPEQEETVQQAEENGIALDLVNHTASKYSRASWRKSDYYMKPDEMAEMLAKNVLGSNSKENVEKAKKFINDINSISDYIGEHSDLLEYIASEGRSSWKSNPEYGGSIDSSTLCPKRWWQTGTIDAIQREMPDYALTAEDFLRIRQLLKENNREVSCGLCFVESSRKNLAKYAKQFMNEWNSQNPDNKVNMVQINTVLGLEDTRKNRPEVYAAYEKFMNKLSQRKPKLFEMRAEYNNDILRHFQNKTEEDKEKVKEKNLRGGIRINSFSDFEIVHLIDMMQVILDMSNVGLAGQAYTKVREFAEALGPTGLKINMSMIAKGVDANGKIIFDEVEGMKWDEVKDLRDKYADNVGTILVVFTEDQLKAAMADDRIDYIIPFHRSQWKKENYRDIGLPDNTKDFTYWQNERYRSPVYKKNKKGEYKKVRATNYMPNEYWDFSLSGKENAERYLQKCWEENKIPKFWKWLDNDGHGKFSLKKDGSTDGYWKLLIDFKMYNHITGEGAQQMPVVPEFDMDACQEMLENYQGGHDNFLVDEKVKNQFIEEKTKGRKGISKKNGKIQLAGNEIEGKKYSKAEEDMEALDAGYWLAHVSPWSGLQTEDERTLQEAFIGKRNSIGLNLLKQSDVKEKIRKLKAREELDTEGQKELQNLQNKLEDLKKELEQKEEELRNIQSRKGFAGKMYQQRMLIGDYVAGRTQDQVMDSVDNMLKEVEEAKKDIEKRTEELKELADTQAVKAMKAYLNKSSLKQQADQLAETWQTTMPKTEIQDRLAAMALKLANGQDISTEAETLATDMMNTLRGVHNEELENLRGVTLTIGKSLVDELKAQNSSLKEIQQKIRGSGIRIIEGGDSSRLVEQWNELRNNNETLPETSGPEIDVLNAIVEYITGQMQGTSGEQVYGEQINMEEVTAAAYVAAASVSLNMVQDPAAKRLISGLMKQIKELSQKQGEIVDNMTALNEKMAQAISAGVRAKSWANVLQNDVDSAIKYYNEMAKLAAQVEKSRVRKDVAEHLRSENAKKLYQLKDKYEQRIKNDRKARQTAEDIKSKRWWIDSQVKTLMKRLTEETDLKNIPEEAKPLARILCSLVVRNDSIAEWRQATFADTKTLERWYDRLERMDAAFGRFNPDRDLDWLVIKAADPEDNDYEVVEKVEAALAMVQQGLMEFKDAEGRALETLEERYKAIERVQDGVNTIYSVIMARSRAFINGKKFEAKDLAKQAKADMKASRFQGERYGRGSRAKDTAEAGIWYGNMTPIYFFKNLKNRVMSMLYSGFEGAEDRSGLEAEIAKAKIAEIAEKYGYRTWNGQEKHQVKVAGGKTIEITTEQLMTLYATWIREQNMVRPEDSSHLLNGGFVLAEIDRDTGKPRRVKREIRPVRMKAEQLSAMGQLLTENQRKFVNAIVHYMSTDLAELGNEASMQVYGIKKYTEQYYFPIKSWGGVLNRSSANGITINKNDNRSGRQSFTRRIMANANNAVEIGDFTPTAMKHIVGMINYNTVFPAVEALNRVLNQQLEYGNLILGPMGEVEEDTRYKQNIRAAFEEAYGRNALKYLEQFMLDINGGTAQGIGNNPYDKLLSVFKKNAVAGSLSVAAQQPMSYIRAAMMIDPKYLVAGMKGEKGAYEELKKYSGVAVLKQMGKFDMNYGRSMIEYITPEGPVSKGRAAYEWASEKSTALPQMMDTWTWTRMWLAVKAEQHDMNPDMDVKSEEFLELSAKRFNELMRRTQVYDSVLVKSQNMRSPHWYMKTITSFMAEPTLTANVLADAFMNIKEKGGKLQAAKAVATFILSAAAQAAVKGFFSAGRSPDKKKNWLENYLYKLTYNLFNEINPLGLVPGYNQIVDTITNGELTDNSMSVIAKAWQVLKNIQKMAEGDGSLYRNLEDSIGQLAQLLTDIPAKNIMRDFRAMVNWFSGGQAGAFTGNAFAQRPTSGAVIKYQTLDTLTSEDLIGIINNELLGKYGYGTTNADYHKRLYEAQKAKQTGRAEELKEYLQLGKGVKDETITENLKKNVKADTSMTTAQQDDWMIDNELMNDTGNITTQYKKGEITREEAKKLYKKINPKMTDNDVWWKLDQMDYNKETGGDVNGNDRYYRLKDAVNANNGEKIRGAVKNLLDHGVETKKVKDKLSDWKSEYLEGDVKTRSRIREAIRKAYQALGLKAEDADKVIDGWKKTKK